MIYLVSTTRFLFNAPDIKPVSVQESLQILEPLKVVGLDTETTGLDPYTKELKLVQLGCKDFQVVIDTTTVDIVRYKGYLESNRLFLLWNAKFDLKWFYKYGIIIKNVYDGFLAEKLMWLGYPAGIHSMSLKTAGEEYLGIELDKSVRGKIIYSNLDEEIIRYGAADVQWLETIREKQLEKLREKQLIVALDIENRFVRVLAYIEWCGVKLDVDKWKEKMKKDFRREEEARKVLDEWVVNWYLTHNGQDCMWIDEEFIFESREMDIVSKYTPEGDWKLISPIETSPQEYGTIKHGRIRRKFPFIYIDLQGDLFTGFDTSPKCTINWNSARQVGNLLKLFGVDTKVDDKEKGGTKDSIDAKVLKPQADKCSLINPYLEYKEAVKVTSTYGENFLEQINPVSGRIHTNYQQLGADTTRITSGGKDKEHNIEYINFLNIPSDAETRACFVAEKGNKWISIDYSGQETYLMASIADDKAIIKELTEGSGDIHSLTAYISYPEIPRDTPIKDIKKLYHNLRQEAKGIEFAINYGGNADTICRNKGIPMAEAEKIYNNYMSGFSGLKKYQDFRRKDWFQKGYILLNPLTGHKAYIYDYDKLKEEKARMSSPNWDWNYYRQMKAEYPECDTVQMVKHFFKRKADSERQSINYPIQASGSMCLRVALINFFTYICDNNLFNKVKITITPYDEINCEAPEEIAEAVAEVVHREMVKSGAIFCTRCKLEADLSRLPSGELPTFWIH